MKRDKNDVMKLFQTLQSWPNPFETSEQLYCLSCGSVVSSGLMCDLLNTYKKEKFASEIFITERLILKVNRNLQTNQKKIIAYIFNKGNKR